jgi:hypothetical protein
LPSATTSATMAMTGTASSSSTTKTIKPSMAAPARSLPSPA